MKKVFLLAWSLGLSSQGLASNSFERVWWYGDQEPYGEYNYSQTVTDGGSTVNQANEWGDAVVSTFMTGPEGRTESKAIDIRFEHNGSGKAVVKLTSSSNLGGLEPKSFNDRDAPKYIPSEGVDLVFSSYCRNCQDVKIQLEDARGHQSALLNIDDYRQRYGRYSLSYIIHVEEFAAETGFRLDQMKSVNLLVDETVSEGSYRLGILYMAFRSR